MTGPSLIAPPDQYRVIEWTVTDDLPGHALVGDFERYEAATAALEALPTGSVFNHIGRGILRKDIGGRIYPPGDRATAVTTIAGLSVTGDQRKALRPRKPRPAGRKKRAP